mmetsp:Transcript_6933/g.24662  ORF Transcript_6933/g.24662 Transcript_6933/m.24662 type:complete len:207 (+) Transcript_6933:1752-2372(+)
MLFNSMERSVCGFALFLSSEAFSSFVFPTWLASVLDFFCAWRGFPTSSASVGMGRSSGSGDCEKAGPANAGPRFALVVVFPLDGVPLAPAGLLALVPFPPFFFRFGSALSLLVSLPFSSFFVFVFPLLLLQSISFPSVDPFFGNVTSWVLIVSNPGWKNGTSSRPYPSCFALGVLCCSCTSRSTRSSSEASSVVTFIALHLPRVFL